MLVELVTHCYAVKYKHYAQGLCYQLGSLLLDKPKNCDVMATICTSKDDKDTIRVIDWAVGEGVKVEVVYLDIDRLGRRAIGRNIAAKITKADLIWYSDCDQVYREGIIDRLIEIKWQKGVVIIYPRRIKINATYELGDNTTNLVGNTPRLLDINPMEFIEKRYPRAIGGVQIVQGFYAKQFGYLDESKKWQRPTNGTFQSCRCDRNYRTACVSRGGRITAVTLPGMYRIRHSIAGRSPGVSK